MNIYQTPLYLSCLRHSTVVLWRMNPIVRYLDRNSANKYKWKNVVTMYVFKYILSVNFSAIFSKLFSWWRGDKLLDELGSPSKMKFTLLSNFTPEFYILETLKIYLKILTFENLRYTDHQISIIVQFTQTVHSIDISFM